MTLKAEYKSPNGSRIFESSLSPISASPSTKDKTAYLSALRSSVATLQEEVNGFLTAKMEEDKALVSTNGVKVDEKEEEENYGEEVIET